MPTNVLSQKGTSILNLLKEVDGHALTLTQIEQMTGMSTEVVKKEVHRLVYSGKGVCFHEGIVFIPNDGENSLYIVVFGMILSVILYFLIKGF